MTHKISMLDQLRRTSIQNYETVYFRQMTKIRDEELREYKREHHMDVVNKNKVDVYV
jgi:hypothetical protein